MSIEVVGQQLRVKVANPNEFRSESYVTLDVGARGRLQLVRARPKSGGKLLTQSVRLNLDDYSDAEDAVGELRDLLEKGKITRFAFREGYREVRRWFGRGVSKRRTTTVRHHARRGGRVGVKKHRRRI